MLIKTRHFTEVGFTEAQAELLIDIQNERFDDLVTKEFLASAIQRTNSKIDGTNSKIDGTNSKIDSTNSRIDSLEKRIDQKIDGLEKRLDQKIDNTNSRIDSLEKRIDHKIDSLEKRVESETRTLKWMVGIGTGLLGAGLTALTIITVIFS